MRLTIDGLRVEISTRRKCDPSKGNKQSERVIGKKEEVNRLNNHLDSLKSEVYVAEKELSLNGEVITADAIRNKLIGKEDKENHHNKQQIA